MSDNWQIKHKEVIQDFLIYLNNKTEDFALKGGTALMECYGLDRITEDINLETKKIGKIFCIVKDFCESRNYIYKIINDTFVVDELIINYGNETKPLKIEVSLRTGFRINEIEKINGIIVYNINKLTNLKINAFNSRCKIRDAYDIVFIYNNYKEKLSESTLYNLIDNITYKGLEYIEYLVENQSDELINKDHLLKKYIDMYFDIERKIRLENQYENVEKDDAINFSNIEKNEC